MGTIHTAFDSSLINAPAKLRKLADEIEEGVYGNVQGVATVLTSDTWTAVFGVGLLSDKEHTINRLLEGIVHLKRDC